MKQSKKIKHALLLFYPDRYFFEVYRNDKEILEDLSYIKQLPSHELILSKLITTFLLVDRGEIKTSSYIKQKLLRTIKTQVKQSKSIGLRIGIRNNIFKIFQKYVFIKTYSDSVNSILIDIILHKKQVAWLLENNTRNIHILNRILRYPMRQKIISIWAENHYKNQVYFDRPAELLGLFINNPLQSFIQKDEKNTLYWGIYYSKISDNNKKALLKKYFSPQYLDQWIDVVTRLKYIDLLTHKL